MLHNIPRDISAPHFGNIVMSSCFFTPMFHQSIPLKTQSAKIPTHPQKARPLVVLHIFWTYLVSPGDLVGKDWNSFYRCLPLPQLLAQYHGSVVNRYLGISREQSMQLGCPIPFLFPIFIHWLSSISFFNHFSHLQSLLFFPLSNVFSLPPFFFFSFFLLFVSVF